MVYSDALTLLRTNGGVATTAQLLTVMTRQQLDVRVRSGGLVRVWYGVYAAVEPDLAGRLSALDAFVGRRVVVCMGTAAKLYGFDTEDTSRVHILDPAVRVRPSTNLMVHQRLGAPLRTVAGRLATAPAWTAIEVARTLRRPRALAALDTALHVGACTPDELAAAAVAQKGRRDIVKVRELLGHVDGRSESEMESEARLVFIDGGLPIPDLQHEIVDRYGRLWRVDFAWPDAMVAAEYDSIDWHMGPQALLHDRLKIARLQECGWTIVPMTVDDVRRDPAGLLTRMATHLSRPRPAA